MTTAQEVKEKLSITDVVGGYVKLLPAGKNFKAPCPFHKEKTPSFIVSPDRGTWHCFGSCGEGGDIISFVMKYENIDFIEALRILAERAGVPLTTMSRDERQWDVLYAINRAAKDYFEKLLWAPEGTAALEYIRGRGLTDETIKLFGIGFGGSSPDGLSRELGRLRFSMADIERAGLIYKTDRGTFWDRFRGRAMFPLLNQFGKTVGFTGRVLPIVGPDGASHDPEGTGKYVNSPETPIFSKSKLLFGLGLAKDSIRTEKKVVLVEGQMDCIFLHQAGVRNVVATSGTALTSDHAAALKRIAETVYLFFDNDVAGHAAADRAISILHGADVAVLIVDYTELVAGQAAAQQAGRASPAEGGREIKDPADVARLLPTALPDLFKKALPAMEYYFSQYLIANQDIRDRKRSIRILLSKIRALPSAVERDHWLKKMALRTGIDLAVLHEEMAAIPLQAIPEPLGVVAQPTPIPSAEPETRRGALSRRLATLIAYNRDWFPLIEKTGVRLSYPYHEIVLSFGGSGFLQPDSQKKADEIVLRAPIEASGTPEELEKEAHSLLRELSREGMRERREELMGRIRQAEAAGDDAALGRLLQEFTTLSRELDSS